VANVKLANSRVFDCLEGLTILDSGRKQGVVLEHSCRTGRCGICKVQVICGDTSVETPEHSLSEIESNEGYILTCCRSAITDVELEASDLGRLSYLQVQTLPARIDSLTKLTEDVLEVVLRTPPTSQLAFLPGQYIDVIGPGGIRRSYSVANAPRGDGLITLHIRKVLGGEMSGYWFGSAQQNDLLRFEGPLGTFCLRETAASRLVLLATGTGIAPVKAILEELQVDAKSCQFEHIYLYWGGRYSSDLYWQPEAVGLPLEYAPVLSREPSWSGKKGYVQDAVLSDGLPLANAVVYACGSEEMIHDAKDSLLQAGLSVGNFYSDAFVQSGGPSL
jgi:CDP-4-dehydro-6-deoxyglucose reductase